MTSRRYALLLVALAALLLVSCVISLGFGPARVPVDVVADHAVQGFLGIGEVNCRRGRNILSG